MDMSDITSRVIQTAEKAGASQAEAFMVRATTKSVYIDDSIPKVMDDKVEMGVGLKFILGKRIGFTCSTLVSETIDDLVERGKTMASISSEDEKFESLPAPKKTPGKRDQFCDRTTSNAGIETLVEKAMLLVESSVSDNVSVPNGVLRSSLLETEISNSLGVSVGSMSTMVFGFFTAKSKIGDKVGEGVQRCWSRNLFDIDFEKIGKKLGTQAIDVLKAKSMDKKLEDVVAVLAPSEGSEMIYALVGFSASANQVNVGSSPWKDRIGDVIAHESLSIVDNGLSETGLMSGIVDDEGIPRQSTPIISKGVLKSYFYDSYNAYQLDMEPTGNLTRHNARDAHGAFRSSGSCSVTNLEVEASSKSFDDLISSIDKGIYVEHFAWPQVDPMSGRFSNEIRNAQLIENGELTTKVKHALLVGNMYECLKKEILSTNEVEVHNRCVLPAIGFHGTEIIGQ
ncbi:MAG: hypothetical protein BAJATHORv1_10280 [Candidatus Thorarchaeota archaeon]|nr:MAG: hypothetical protein BAJATHORv1_10280 [Candidatus Thorarchaeota archaeon]